MSLRKIAAALAEAGHLNERGQPFNPKSIVARWRKRHKRDDPSRSISYGVYLYSRDCFTDQSLANTETRRDTADDHRTEQLHDCGDEIHGDCLSLKWVFAHRSAVVFRVAGH